MLSNFLGHFQCVSSYFLFTHFAVHLSQHPAGPLELMTCVSFQDTHSSWHQPNNCLSTPTSHTQISGFARQIVVETNGFFGQSPLYIQLLAQKAEKKTALEKKRLSMLFFMERRQFYFQIKKKYLKALRNPNPALFLSFPEF